MRAAVPIVALYACATLLGQPVPGQPDSGRTANETKTFSDPRGFSYAIPGDWDVVGDADTATPDKPAQPDKAPGSAAKKGMECAEVPVTAIHGDPISTIVEVVLPFDCFGQAFSPDQLSDFGIGTSQGLKESFDIAGPIDKFYSIGSHRLWVQRSRGTVKGKPEPQYTVEIACTLLKKAAVCWMAMAADSTSLDAFEQGAVTLEGDSPTPLVPSGTFPIPAPQH
ncbi:MAG TPA: hypothetical protein VL986_05040 [Terracidiphilus sp.]|nr:hypothetical protein [Terracidiphilus sp.]